MVVAVRKYGPPLCSCPLQSRAQHHQYVFYMLALEVWPCAPTDQEVGQWILCLLILPLSYDATPASWGRKSSGCFVFLFPCLPSKCWSSGWEKHANAFFSFSLSSLSPNLPLPPSPSPCFFSVCWFFLGTKIHSLMPDLIPNSICLLTD